MAASGASDMLSTVLFPIKIQNTVSFVHWESSRRILALDQHVMRCNGFRGWGWWA